MSEEPKKRIEIPSGIVAKSIVRELYNMKQTVFTKLINDTLFDELSKTGYKKNDKHLLPITLEKLIELIGHPDNLSNAQKHL